MPVTFQNSHAEKHKMFSDEAVAQHVTRYALLSSYRSTLTWGELDVSSSVFPEGEYVDAFCAKCQAKPAYIKAGVM